MFLLQSPKFVSCFLMIYFIPVFLPKSFAWPDWRDGDRCKWAVNCDFEGHDLYSRQGPGEACSGICADDGSCTHFTWTRYNGGTCWLKQGDNLPSKRSNEYSNCGYIIRQEQEPRRRMSSLEQTKMAIKAGAAPIRGVNLGGWLVAEHWMTKGSPAWEGVPEDIASEGEYSTMKLLGHERGDGQFERHRQNFIREEDFKDIAAVGLNTVRIPVGYWITGFDKSGGGDPDGWKVYAPDAIAYLDQAIREWAPRNGLLVLISFHAAKGSQNGNDHSSPSDPGHAHWSNYAENVANSLDAVEWLAMRYKDETSFLGIGLLNEPKDQNVGVLKQYYYDAYGRIRAFSDCLLTTSPLLSQQGPSAEGDWAGFMAPPNFQGVRHEWHRYLVWGFEQDKGFNPAKLIDFANKELANDVGGWTGNWLFVGEWSIAASFSMNDATTLRRYAQAQLKAFHNAKGGWTYWSWKSMYGDDGTSSDAWSMKSMIQKGLLQLNLYSSWYRL